MVSPLTVAAIGVTLHADAAAPVATTATTATQACGGCASRRRCYRAPPDRPDSGPRCPAPQSAGDRARGSSRTRTGAYPPVSGSGATGTVRRPPPRLVGASRRQPAQSHLGRGGQRDGRELGHGPASGPAATVRRPRRRTGAPTRPGRPPRAAGTRPAAGPPRAGRRPARAGAEPVLPLGPHVLDLGDGAHRGQPAVGLESDVLGLDVVRGQVGRVRAGRPTARRAGAVAPPSARTPPRTPSGRRGRTRWRRYGPTGRARAGCRPRGSGGPAGRS